MFKSPVESGNECHLSFFLIQQIMRKRMNAIRMKSKEKDNDDYLLGGWIGSSPVLVNSVLIC